MLLSDQIILAAYLAVPLLFSLTVHEYSHARVALAFGDDTAKRMGRVTLNPIKHLDLFGTIALFIVHFGWAKPVPINPMNLHPRRFAQVAVSFAGPGSNIMLALGVSLLFRLLPVSFLNTTLTTFSNNTTLPLAYVLYVTVLVNLALAMFNMIPLFPLDGHHILREMLPADQQYDYMKMQILYGRWMLLALIFVPRLMGPNVEGPIGLLFSHAIEPLTMFLLGGHS
jgi:Zn-dependent protease